METSLMKSLGLRFLRGGNPIHVDPAKIIRLESMSNYTKVYFSDQVPIVMAKVLHAYEDELRPYGFVRIHRSHLVNLNHVKNVDEQGYVQMEDTSRLKFSRRKLRDGMSLFINRSI